MSNAKLIHDVLNSERYIEIVRQQTIASRGLAAARDDYLADRIDLKTFEANAAIVLEWQR